ncbi:MAG: Pycsar system effector family protein [Pseudomonadota bacterium]
MNSALLNIWRENGAYLRFADAKNGIIASVALTILISYVQYFLISSRTNWFSIPEILAVADVRAVEYIICAALLTAFLLSSLSIVPTLSKNALRTELFVAMARFFSVIRYQEKQGIVYFLDVAAFPSHEAYRRRLAECVHNEDFDDLANRDLVEQIWLVSRIGSAKHFVFLNSAVLVLVALILSFIS